MFKILTLISALLIGATQGALAMAQEFPKKHREKMVVQQ